MTSVEINEFIKQNYIQMPASQMSVHLPLSISAISRRRQRMGLKSPNRSYAMYSLPILPIAARCYELWINGMSTKEISKIIKLSQCTISKHISRFLPIKKGEGEVIICQSKINL